MTTSLVLTVLSYLLPLVAGYLLRHYGISVPGLPTPTAVPAVPVASSTTGDHVGLLQQVLGVGKTEAEALLKQAVQAVIQQGLADLKAASQPAPVQPPKA